MLSFAHKVSAILRVLQIFILKICTEMLYNIIVLPIFACKFNIQR